MFRGRHWWQLAAVMGTASVLAASCSTSPSAAPTSSTTPATIAVPSTVATPTTTPKKSDNNDPHIYGTFSNGESITGNSGTGNTGSVTAPGDNTGVAGITTTTAAAAATGATPATDPAYVVNKFGRVRKRHANPVVLKFRPLSSPVGGTVIIMGKRLQKATTVTFDGIRATIRSNTSTHIRAVVPPGATSGPISVITPNGTSTVSGFTIN